MDNSEFTKPPEVEEIEKVVTPAEFLSLATDYINSSLTPQSQKLLDTLSDLPDSLTQDDTYKQYIEPASRQLNTDLPQIAKATAAAISGDPVQVIVRPAGSFFDLGKRIDQDNRPPETTESRTFTPEQIPELVEVFHRSMENSTRQDASLIVGFSELLAMLNPDGKPQLDAIREQTLGISAQTTRIEDAAKNTLAGQPISIITSQGKPSLNIKR